MEIWPLTFRSLQKIGVGLSITEWLEIEIGADRDASDVILALYAAILAQPALQGDGPLADSSAARKELARADTNLVQAIARRLQGITAQAWPTYVADFPALA